MTRTLDARFEIGGRNGERLRQFVEGTPVTAGSEEKRLTVPEDYRLAAIRDFLLKVGYLSEQDLMEEPPSDPAAVALHEYLQVSQDKDAVGELPSEALEGSFEACSQNNRGTHLARLTLNLISDGLFQVDHFIEEYPAAEAPENVRQWSEQKRRRCLQIKRKYVGWAVKNENDCLYVFAKGVRFSPGLVNYILTDYCEQSGPVDWLLLQEYGYIAYSSNEEEPSEARKTVLNLLERQYLHSFQRAQ
ncbi:MAG TPA: hypothetical protein VKA19_08950 [Alphaproteobacteria bacterium]|nr:hypothetical protein [Alphaproteobacteria bacterium]